MQLDVGNEPYLSNIIMVIETAMMYHEYGKITKDF